MAKLNIVSISHARLGMATESAKYDSGNVTNGYGQVSGVYVTVQKGTSADINVDMEIETISKETFNQWKSEVSNYFTEKQKSQLEENYGGFGLAGGYFSGCFGILFAGGDHNHYKNASDSFETKDGSKNEGFASSVYNLTKSKFKVTGKLTARGTSFIPVTVSAYVQVTKITFSDKKELHVISTDDATVAQKDGSTKGAEVSDNKISMVPW